MTTFKKYLMERPEQTETPEFKAWFGASKVVDSDGNPLVVYHGTNVSFDEFRIHVGERSKMVGDWAAAYFTTDKSSAESAARFAARMEGGTPRVYACYLKATNPAMYGKHKTVEDCKADGYDSRLTDSGHENVEWAVFSPEQIKSATDNNGRFGNTGNMNENV